MTHPRKENSLKKILHSLNVARYICNVLIGKKHSIHHRVFIGAIVMFLGVCISKQAAAQSQFLVQFTGDAIGYLIHGLGCIPFIEIFVKTFGD